jgi:hypothetical protein
MANVAVAVRIVNATRAARPITSPRTVRTVAHAVTRAVQTSQAEIVMATLTKEELDVLRTNELMATIAKIVRSVPVEPEPAPRKPLSHEGNETSPLVETLRLVQLFPHVAPRA